MHIVRVLCRHHIITGIVSNKCLQQCLLRDGQQRVCVCADTVYYVLYVYRYNNNIMRKARPLQQRVCTVYCYEICNVYSIATIRVTRVLYTMAILQYASVDLLLLLLAFRVYTLLLLLLLHVRIIIYLLR